MIVLNPIHSTIKLTLIVFYPYMSHTTVKSE